MADEELPTPDTQDDPADNALPEDPIEAATATIPAVSIGREVLNVSIEDEMRQSYLDYAMSTIIARALPDVRDGLKPVQRRILMAMSDLNLTPGSQHRKSAKVVGECFVAGTLVSTPHGQVPIEALNIGDTVYTQTGIRAVTQAYVMPPQTLREVELSSGAALRCTPGQQFKVWTPELTPIWKTADELTPGDYIVSRAAAPSVTEYQTADGITVDEDMAYLLGFFLADGWVDRDRQRGYDRLSFACADLSVMERLRGILCRKFDVSAGLGERDGLYTLRVHSIAANRRILQVFGLHDKFAKTNSFPDVVLQSPPPVVQAFLDGFRSGNGLNALTSSQAAAVRDLADNDISFAQVKAVKEAAEEVTYDIQVEGDHEFIANGVLVHNCMGNYHPHGDAAIYATMVRLAQDFSLRYLLVDGQGNFGSIDADPPAAQRYTECRMAPAAVEMLQDLDRDTVDWTDNYDQTRQEPTVLPGKFPNFLCNGGSGIAVGMATNVPPHNLREVVDGAIHLLDNPEATSDDLLEFIKGPDFPTAGLILGVKGIKQAYATGRGSVIMQARTTIEPIEGGRNQIIITELPYQVIKSRLIEQIAELVKQKKIEGIADLNDYTDRHGMRVVVTLKREAYPKKVLNFLLKHTPLRTTFGVNMLALVDGQPRTLSLPQALNYFLTHRREVIVRRTLFELNKAKARAHILEGLQIALDFLDEIIALIRASRTAEIARTEMMSRYTLSQLQADAILAMQLRALTGLEREKLENDYKELLKQISFYEDILANPSRVTQIIKTELKQMRDKYGDERRTRIVPMEAEEIGDEDLIPEEEMIVSITRDGYIKRVPKDTYPTQHRGGKGRIGATTKEEDTIEHLFLATTHHYILFFTDRGRVYRLKAYEVPQTSRTAMGTAIINLINIQPGERITATVPMKQFRDVEGYLLLATECGEVKRTKLAEFANLRNNGLIVFDIEENDALRWVAHTSGSDEAVLVTRKGMSIRFAEDAVPSRGRAAGGVRGIRLSEEKDDRVVGMGVVQADKELLVISEKGISKRTPFSEYRITGRGGIGIKTMALTDKTGDVVDAKVVDKDDRLLIMTQNGITIRLRVDDIRSSGRSTQGVRAINLAEDDWVASVERVTADKGPTDSTDVIQPA